MAHHGKIPRPTVKRLSLYLRELEKEREQGRVTISSRQLGSVLDLTDAQVRKDLAYFGQFGHPGKGYDIEELTGALRRILGVDHTWRAVIVGAGNIGRAIMSYGRLRRRGFEIVAIFDAEDEVVGSEIADTQVRPMSELVEVVQSMDVRIGLIAVPAEAAQDVSDTLVAAGVRGVLNFAPTRLAVNDDIAIISVDLSATLEQLAFAISAAQPSSGAD